MSEVDLVDTSYWQGPVDTASLDVGVIAKATQGAHFRDPFLVGTVTGASARGVRYVGGYHFLTDEDPIAQLDNFCARIDDCGIAPEVLPAGFGLAIDYEPNSIMGTPAPPVTVLEKLCSRVADVTGDPWRVGIYCDLSRRAKIEAEMPHLLSEHPLWIAYPGPTPDVGAVLHQFDVRSDVAGVNGPVDCDRIVHREAFDAWFGRTQPSPPPIHWEHTMYFLVSDLGMGDGVFAIELNTIRWLDGIEFSYLSRLGIPSTSATEGEIRDARAKRDPKGPPPPTGRFVGLW